MGEAISPRVRLFPLRVRLFHDRVTSWAPCRSQKIDEIISVAKSLEIKDLCNTEIETNFEAKEEPQQTDPVIQEQGGEACAPG